MPRPRLNYQGWTGRRLSSSARNGLLSLELGPKETCLRLIGVSTMILALHNSNDDSVARTFMVIEISQRVREILRAPPRYESSKDGSRNEDGKALKAPALDDSRIRGTNTQAR